MDIDGVENVSLSGSFVLGWERADARLVLHLEVLLTSSHARYEAPRAGEVGCFRLAELAFDRVRRIEGLVPDRKELVFDDGLGEYRDVFEIYEWSLDEDRLTLDTDENQVVIEAAHGSLRVEA